MRFVSWNVNGIRAVLKKNFLEVFDAFDADIFAIQETKCQVGQVELDLPGYHQYWSAAEKKGYSGTAVFTREEPLRVLHGLGNEYLDAEGRIVACEFPQFWFVNVYTPNSQMELARIDHRMEWDDAFRDFCKGLEAGVLPDGSASDPKPVVMCGAGSSPSWWTPASPTRSACCTPMRRVATAGGATDFVPVRQMRDGASTTSS